MIHILQPSALSVNKHSDAYRRTSTWICALQLAGLLWRISWLCTSWLRCSKGTSHYHRCISVRSGSVEALTYITQKKMEKSGNIPSLSTHQWSCNRALRASMLLKRVLQCTNTQLLLCSMQAVGVQLNGSLCSLKIICGRACVSMCVCGRVVDSSALKE